MDRIEYVARRLCAQTSDGAAQAADWDVQGAPGRRYWFGLAQEACDAVDAWLAEQAGADHAATMRSVREFDDAQERPS